MRAILIKPAGLDPRDDITVRARRFESEVLGPKCVSFLASWQQRIYLGFYEEGGFPLVLFCDGQSTYLWINEQYRDSPLVLHFSGRVGEYLTHRFHIGAISADRSDCYLVRMSWKDSVGHIMCLPTAEGADRYIHFYRIQSVEEWANVAGYESDRISEEELARRAAVSCCMESTNGEAVGALIEKLEKEHWETCWDPRTGDLWCRRPVGVIV